MFLPSPSDLLVNLSECRELVLNLLQELPDMFSSSGEGSSSAHAQSAVGAALQAAYKIAAPTGEGWGELIANWHILLLKIYNLAYFISKF